MFEEPVENKSAYIKNQKLLQKTEICRKDL